MHCRPRAHPKGTPRLVRIGLTPIETENGDIWQVPRGQVIERDRIARLFRDGASG